MFASVKFYAKNTTSMIKFKILSLEDLRTEEFDFLHSRYGIIYIYANEEYYLDELLETIQKLEKLFQRKIKMT